MNWIDLLLVMVVLLALWSGWQRGFVSSFLGLVTWAGSFVIAYFTYPAGATFIAGFTQALGTWLNAVSFISIVILSRILLHMLAGFLLQETDASLHQNTLNKFLGLFPGFINGLIQAIVVSALLLTLPFQNRVSDKARESQLANTFAPPAFWLSHALAPIFSEPLRNTLPAPVHVPGEKEEVKLPFTVTHPSVRQDLETQMLELVNAERIKKGLQKLVADPEMRKVARAHSIDMFARGYFAHVNLDGKDPFDRMRAARVKYKTAGENLALAQTLQQAHEGLMKSPGHRANILQPQFGRVGIGILDGGIYGLMITQNFRN